MKLFGHSAERLADRTALLLTADPGEALPDAARLYDPQVRRWARRLVFCNGVLLFGPITVTPKIEQRAGLPAGLALASESGGIALEMMGFIINSADDLVPRSCLPVAAGSDLPVRSR
jgi:hypothetical protein